MSTKSLFFVFLFYQGDTERAEELAQQKRDAAKALEAQVQKAKAAAAEPSEEIATTVLDPKAIPKTSAGLLTHSCMAIFEMITNGLLASDVLVLEASSNVDVLYQDGLSGSVLPDASFVHWNMTGPLMLACPDEHEPQALPSWWTKCSEQLKQTCSAAIPGHMTPSSYVACCFFSVTFSLVHVRNGDPYQNRFNGVSRMHTKVFTDSQVQGHLAKFDWLHTAAAELYSHFPAEAENTIVKKLLNLSITRFAKDSFACGVTELLAGRVVYCVSGVRVYMGMSIQKVVETFNQQFNQDPTSLRQCASWLHKMPLEVLMSNGFYCMVRKGDVLVIPSCFLIVEAALGVNQDECDVITWSCVAPKGDAWRKQFALLRDSPLLAVNPEKDGTFAHVVQGVVSGMTVLEKLLLLTDVKVEQPNVRSRVHNEPHHISDTDALLLVLKELAICRFK